MSNKYMRWQSVRWTRLLTLLALLLPLTGWAQTPVTISTTTPYTQDFDGQGATGTAYEPGWLGIKASGTSTTVANGATLAPIVTDGSANSGAMYNVGAATTTERALGSLASAGIVPRFGAVFQNATGSTVTQVDLAGFMEQWRSASNATVLETLPFEFSFDATSLATGTWTAVAGMNLVEKLTASAAAAAVNGNLAANRTAISGTIGSLSWANGTTMWIRWSDTDNTGSDGIYALDDFSLTVTTASTVTLAEINLKQGATSYLTASTYSGFANTTLGSTDVKTFTVENLGGTALAVSSIVATGDFSVTGTVPTTVAANGTATFDVTFTPAATGTRTGTVTIASDDADEASYVVNLSAVGQASTPNPLIAISQAGTAYASASTFSGFANTTQGATSAPVTFTITNGSTTDALVIAGISTTGNFAVSGTAPTTVAAGGTATFDLTFGPTAAGTRTGTVTITNNSQGTPSYVISLSGEGTPPAPTATSYSATSLLAGILSNEVVSGTNLTGATVTVTGSTAGTVVVGTATATATQVSFTLLAPQAGSFTLNIATGGGTLTQTIDVTTPPAGFFEPFEAGSKSSTYASGNVTLTTGPWNFTEALLGNQPPSATPGSGEKKNNGQAVRFRTLGTATMNFDKANGAGTISFVAALYGTDAAQPTPATALLVEISTNGGTSYAPVGSITPTATLSPYSLTANVAGSIRLRFSSNTAGTTPRLNLDDLLVADYAAPVACAAPGTPAFGSITQTSAEVTVAAGPDGTGPFTVTATPTAGGSAITAAGASPISLTGLTAGTTYSVTVTSGCNAGFSSPSQASAAASLTTAAATPVPTLAVTQGGTSYPSAGTAYAFGNQTVGTTSAPVAFTLTNGGPDALTISGISTTGDYALSGAAPTTVAAGGTATVSATFAPTAAGTRAGTLVITSNATNAATYTVNLTGTGVAAPLPDLVVSTTQLVSGSYNNVTVTPTGVATLSGPLAVAGALLVQTGGVLQQNCQLLNGAGSFTLQAGAGLVVCDPAGITATGATGAIQVAGTRSYSPGAAYIYNGTAAQLTGAGLPAQVGGLGVANPFGLTLSQAVAVSQQVTLQVGNLNTNGQQLTLLSSAAGTAFVVNTGGVVNGTATVQRYIDNANPVGYRHYAAPVSNTTLADLATAGFAPTFNPAYNTSPTPGTVTPFPTVFGYDQARVATVTSTYSSFDKGWFSPLAADAMLPTRGYTVNAPNTALVDFVGTLNNGPQPSGPLARGTGSEEGWHLLGNPYPAPLDWSTVAPAQRPGMDAAMYVFQSSGQYGGSYRTFANGVGGSSLIPAASGYFARVTTPGTLGAVNLTNANRVTTPVATPAFGRGTADNRPQLHLQLRGAAGLDEAYLYFEAGATAGLDARYDAVKLANPSGFQLASAAAGQHLAINGLPVPGATALVVPLAVAVPQAGSYAIGAAEVANFGSGTVTLLDALTGTRTVLTAGASYAFVLSGPAAPGRFAVEFRSSGALATTAANALAAQTQLFPNPASASFRVVLPVLRGKAPVAATLTNALGQTVLSRSLSAPAGQAITAEFDVRGLARGVYTLRLTLDGEQVVRKVVVE